MFWPSIWSRYQETPMNQTERQLKESLILEAYNYNDKARRMASANSMYMGSGATAKLFEILGSAWPKISIFNAMSAATDEQINAALAYCEPYLAAAKRDKPKRFLKPGEPTDNVPHEIVPLDHNQVDKDWDMLRSRFEEAIEIKPDTTLRTKDGRRFGNAFVIKYEETTNTWLIETDFGNRVSLTSTGITEAFYLGFHQPYEEWAQTRFEKIQSHNQPEDPT
jgi:hypothetical protein